MISEHITLAEATKSQDAIRKGLDNTPNEKQIANMKMLANEVFEPLRKWHGKPIHVSSFFRSFLVNNSIGGSKSSQHMAGHISGLEEAAMDIDADHFNNGISNKDIFEWIKKNLEFDQLIWEFGDDKNPAWVHVSKRKTGNRKQLLKAVKLQSGTKYIPI